MFLVCSNLFLFYFIYSHHDEDNLQQTDEDEDKSSQDIHHGKKNINHARKNGPFVPFVPKKGGPSQGVQSDDNDDV